MSAPTAFALRPLERNGPSDALEGAFRVHLVANELKNLGLVAGDIVRISNSKGFRGYAIAWLAPQTNPAKKPIAKTTDLLRDKYSLTLTDTIVIEKADDTFKPFESVEVGYDGSSDALDCYDSPQRLVYWTRYALGRLDVILPGCTFDVQPEGLQYHLHKGPKLRVTVLNVVPSSDATRSLHFDVIQSKLTMSNRGPTHDTSAFYIDEAGIGGLSDSIKMINKFVNMWLNYRGDPHLLGPNALLIHGIQGCGKSLLLERLSERPWNKVFHVDLDSFTSNRSKAQAEALSKIFDQARLHEPSLIVMDDFDKLVSKAEPWLDRLRRMLEKFEGTRVVIAAAARDILDIDSKIRKGVIFYPELELFPPNIQQREDILRKILGTDMDIQDVDLIALAERAHGFVGGDIRKLCTLARNHRAKRVYEAFKAENQGSIVHDIAKAVRVKIEDFNAVMDHVRPTLLGDNIIEVPKVQWTDIAGIDKIREKLYSVIIRPQKHPELIERFGGGTSCKGILLYGPPGCAKTLIAKAVATECNQNFLAIKGSELINMFVGESERAIRNIFRRARAAKPCVMFFDEIDAIGKSRGLGQDSGLNVVTTLLNEMDGIEDLKGVFVIGATNRPDILDRALIRAGRFDVHIHIGLPNEVARRQIFEIHTRTQPLTKEVDLNILASKTQGSTGADIKGLCQVAVEYATHDYLANQMSNTGRHEIPAEVRMQHFEKALESYVPRTDPDEAQRYELWTARRSIFEG